jgi:hypothetical protein
VFKEASAFGAAFASLAEAGKSWIAPLDPSYAPGAFCANKNNTKPYKT